MFCPSCGTQNADTSRFCMKCGTALPSASQQLPVSPPIPTPSPRNAWASAATLGGGLGLAGGVITIIGFLMPWSSVLVAHLSGLDITLAALTSGFAGLQSFQYGGVLLVCTGGFVAIVNGAIPLLGFLCARTGLEIFERRTKPDSDWYISTGLKRLRSRATKGVVLTALMFLVPLALSAIFAASQPGLFAAGMAVSSLFPTGGFTSGFFVAAGGFVLAYIGSRLALSQVSTSHTENEHAISSTTSNMPTISSISIDKNVDYVSCPKCDTPNRKGRLYCVECSTKLE